MENYRKGLDAFQNLLVLIVGDDSRIHRWHDIGVEKNP